MRTSHTCSVEFRFVFKGLRISKSKQGKIISSAETVLLSLYFASRVEVIIVRSLTSVAQQIIIVKGFTDVKMKVNIKQLL